MTLKFRPRFIKLMGMRINMPIFVCSLFLAAGLGAEDAATAFWPEHFGPDRSNQSREKNLLRRWPEEGPPKLWTFPHCGKGYAGVTVADGMVFTVGDFEREERIIALDMQGKLLWQNVNGEAWRGACPGSRAVPAYNEGALYHMNPKGRLAAYEAKTGKPLWSVDLKAEFDARWGIWGLAESLIVEGDRIICMPGGERGRVVALDKRTGRTLWANTEIQHSAAYCSGRIVTHDGRRKLLSLTQRSIVGVDVENGRLLWTMPFVPRYPQNALTPVYHNGHVFIACGHSSGGTLLKPDLSTGTAETIWYREDLDDCHSGTVLIDGRLYGSACRNGGDQFYCVDFMTGETIHADKTLGKVGITYADGMIYALNFQGAMHLIKVTETGFDLVSRFDLPKRPPNSYLALPVVCGGRLYVRCGSDLHAYDIRAQ
jgi:outer membrane protein assembly factor BamB